MAARKQKQDKSEDVTLERDGKTRVARTAEEVVRLKFDGWKVKEAKKVAATPSGPKPR